MFLSKFMDNLHNVKKIYIYFLIYLCYNKNAKRDIPTEIENSAAVRNIKI